MKDLQESYLRSFCYHFIEMQEHIPLKEKNDFLDIIDEYDIYELLSFLTFGDVLIENESFINTSFVDSPIGQYVLSEADDSSVGQIIKRVIDKTIVPVKNLGKGLYWIGGRIGKKIKSAGLPGKDPLEKSNLKNTDNQKKIKRSNRIASLKKFGKMASWVAIPAAAIAASYIIYKKFFSKAAVACKKSPDKQECLKNFKTKALQAQIQKLMQSRGKCASSNEPEKCANKIDNLIAKKRLKISEL